MICVVCGRDINAIGQDNVSYISGKPMCEDCCGIVIHEEIDMDFEMVFEKELNKYFGSI